MLIMDAEKLPKIVVLAIKSALASGRHLVTSAGQLCLLKGVLSISLSCLEGALLLSLFQFEPTTSDSPLDLQTS